MTPGIISVTKDGKVVVKIIAGSDGMYALEVARDLRALGRVPTIEEAYDISKKRHLGSCGLVVMDESREKSDFEDDGELHPRYRETFQNPRFNPRWEHGYTEFYEEIRF